MDGPGPDGWLPWHLAWQEALFGPGGFYRRPEGPAGHFRTAAHAAPDELAQALVRFAIQHERTAIVDLGAGRGELLNAVHRAARDAGVTLRLEAVDVVARPAGLEPGIGWSPGLDALPAGAMTGALVIAWELLDTVPCIVIEADDAGHLRLVEVERGTGRERLAAADADRETVHETVLEAARWCDRWWPGAVRPGQRVEVGEPRDEVWRLLVQRAAEDGDAVLLCVDYVHVGEDRPPGGTLAGYRGGRLMPPVPDGTCDITAHVAIDSVAVAGQLAGASTIMLTTQREALLSLGVTGRLIPGQAVTAAALARVSREAELIDPEGLGSFVWLLQSVRSGG